MTHDEAVQKLREMAEEPYDEESGHIAADEILLQMIERYVPQGHLIVEAYEALPKWYA